MGTANLLLGKFETEVAFATENDPHSWADVRMIEPAVTPDQLHHEKVENQQRITQYRGHVLGRKSESKFTFGHYLIGDGVALNGAATPADDTLQDLLALCMGGSSSGAGSTCEAGCTTTSVIVEAGHGARFKAGQAIMVEGTSDDDTNEISIIESISTDTLTLKIALSNAPAENAVVWNSYTSYIDPSATDSGQFQIIGDDAADVWLLLGCVGGFTIQDLLQSEAAQLPRLNFDMMVTSWEKDSGTLAAGSYDGGALLGPAEEMEIHYQTHGTTTRNLVCVSALEIVPGITWTKHMARGCAASQQHVDRIRMTQVAPTVSFTADPSSSFWTAHTAGTEKLFAIMFGRTPGQSWCIEIPRAVLNAVPTRDVAAEQIATKVSLRADEDNCGAATTALELSPIRIHRL